MKRQQGTPCSIGLLATAMLLAAACDATEPVPRTETWTGFTVPDHLDNRSAAADNDTIWYSMIFEYADEGAWEDDEIWASLLVWEELEEGDRDCDLEWLPRTDPTCQVVTTGRGLHAESYPWGEHIFVSGLEIPTLDSPCTFAGPVSSLGLKWYADLRCGEKADHVVTVHFSTTDLHDDRR